MPVRVRARIGLGIALGGAALGVRSTRLAAPARRRPDLDGFLEGRGTCVVLTSAARKSRHPSCGQPRRPRAPAEMQSRATRRGRPSRDRPMLPAYDGSELAELAIEQAGRQLAPGRDALILCVWQPADVGSYPTGGRRFDAGRPDEVRKAAEQTAAHGASLAEGGQGSRRRAWQSKAPPPGRGWSRPTEECGASLIVLGSHRRSGLSGHLLGSVSAAVAGHSASSVLIVHNPD